MAVSFITNLPAPVNKGKPNSPLPRLGTHTSGVVTRKESVPRVMIIASPAPTSPTFGQKDAEECKDTDAHNKNTQSVRKTIRIILLVPLMLHGIKFSFFQLILFIVGSIVCIEEAHKRAVCHKRYDAFRFIIPELQPADPNENNKN